MGVFHLILECAPRIRVGTRNRLIFNQYMVLSQWHFRWVFFQLHPLFSIFFSCKPLNRVPTAYYILHCSFMGSKIPCFE